MPHRLASWFAGSMRQRHVIRTLEHDVEHLKDLADRGESPRTPALLIGLVLLVVVPLVLTFLAVATLAAHFA